MNLRACCSAHARKPLPLAGQRRGVLQDSIERDMEQLDMCAVLDRCERGVADEAHELWVVGEPATPEWQRRFNIEGSVRRLERLDAAFVSYSCNEGSVEKDCERMHGAPGVYGTLVWLSRSDESPRIVVGDQGLAADRVLLLAAPCELRGQRASSSRRDDSLPRTNEDEICPRDLLPRRSERGELTGRRPGPTRNRNLSWCHQARVSRYSRDKAKEVQCPGRARDIRYACAGFPRSGGQKLPDGLKRGHFYLAEERTSLLGFDKTIREQLVRHRKRHGHSRRWAAAAHLRPVSLSRSRRGRIARMRSSKVVRGVTVVSINGQAGRCSTSSSSSRAEAASTIMMMPVVPLMGPPATIFFCSRSFVHISKVGKT